MDLRFLGRHLVGVSPGRGHRVTLFNRGDPGLFPGAGELLRVRLGSKL